MADNQCHMQVLNMEHYAACVRHATVIGETGHTNFRNAFARFVDWFALGIPLTTKPGVARYRITIQPDLWQEHSFYGALVADLEPSKGTRGQTELIRNGGLIYDRHEHTWGVHT